MNNLPVQNSPTLTVGHSVENRPIYLHLYNMDESTHLDTLFIGIFHGDEGIAGELMTQLIQYLDTHPETVLSLKKPFGIIPVLNPDGLEKNQRMNANAVDLNRNFPTQNWIEENKDSIYYSGPAAGSEPETQLVIQLIKKYHPKKIITVHSPYRVINFDGDDTSGAEKLANTMANAMPQETAYKVVADIGYPTPGSFGTYAGKERGIPTITLELPEDEPLEIIWQDNQNALLEAIRF